VELIVVSSPEKAQEILTKLRAGADFAALATENSTDPTASDGGSLGNVDPDSLRLELRNALQGLKPGDFSGIFRIPAGYAIVKIVKGQQTAPASEPLDPTRALAVGSQVSARQTHDFSGYTEFLTSLVRTMKGPHIGLDISQVCDARQQAPSKAIATLEAKLASKDAPTDPSEVGYVYYTLGALEASRGNIDKAIEHWQVAYRLGEGTGPGIAQGLEETLGVAYLHRTQRADGAIRGTINEGWLVPSHPGAMDQRPEDAEKAIEWLTKALRREPSNTEIQWLLNLAYMTAGTWPAAVPAEFVIPPSAFRSEEDLGRFRDVAPAVGLGLVGTAGGVIVDDMENDGLLDVIVSEVDDCAGTHFFHNNGDGTFTERTAQAGLLDQKGAQNLIQADYNNDGCVDFLIMRGGWEFPRRRSLLRNNCDGTFTDVTAQAGLLEPLRSSQTAVWTDIDNDGNLDLFVGNENAPAQLFLNKGDGTFVDIAREAGLDRITYAKSVVAADYDNDGYPDLYVSNYNGEGFLYHNNGDRTFTEVSKKAGIQSSRFSFGAMFLDYDNDGWPDLLINCYYPSVEEVARNYEGLPRKGDTMKLYRNVHDGTFRDVTAEVGLERIFMPMGYNFGDIDNDGFLDVYLGMGNPSFASVMPNVLLHNKEGKRFVDISTSSGTGAIAKGHGVAFADFSNNGNEDILADMGGPDIGDKFPLHLFRNPGGHGNNWITLKLVGVKSNRSAIGARITVTVNDPDRGRRQICRSVGSGGSFGASPLEQHIGIGRSARIENIEVWWPASKTRQNFRNVTPNQFLEIREFAQSAITLKRRSFELGAAPRTSQVSAR